MIESYLYGMAPITTHAAGNTKELRYEQWKLINPY